MATQVKVQLGENTINGRLTLSKALVLAAILVCEDYQRILKNESGLGESITQVTQELAQVANKDAKTDEGAATLLTKIAERLIMRIEGDMKLATQFVHQLITVYPDLVKMKLAWIDGEIGHHVLEGEEIINLVLPAFELIAQSVKKSAVEDLENTPPEEENGKTPELQEEDMSSEAAEVFPELVIAKTRSIEDLENEIAVLKKELQNQAGKEAEPIPS